MTSKDIGLIGKYIVERVDGKPVDWCFVLEGKDPLAWPALLTYADMAEGTGNLQLATDLRTKVAEFGIGAGSMERTWDDRAVLTGPDRGGISTVYTTDDLAEIRQQIDDRNHE